MLAGHHHHPPPTHLSGVARIEEQSRALQTHPVALPAPLPGQLHLVLLTQQPLLHAQEPRLPHRARAVERGSGAALG